MKNNTRTPDLSLYLGWPLHKDSLVWGGHCRQTLNLELPLHNDYSAVHAILLFKEDPWISKGNPLSYKGNL